MQHLLSDSLFGPERVVVLNRTRDFDGLGLEGLIQRRGMQESGLCGLSVSSLLIKHSACQNTGLLKGSIEGIGIEEGVYEVIYSESIV